MELEPLRQFGVNMTAANLETYAFANGVNKAWNELSQAEQTLIRYNYILENTRTAQGDVARSADSYAYATKQLELALSNVGQGFGEQLLPGLTRIKEVVADFLETNKDTIEFIGAITGTVVNMVGAALKFLETLLKPVQGILNLVSKAATGLLDILNGALGAWINFWDSAFSKSEDTLNEMGYDLQDLNQLMEDLNIDSVSSFEDMYSKIQSLSGEHYDELKGMASDYNDEYKAQQGALDDYVSDGVKARMREVEKEYEGKDKTANDYMKLARIEANEKRRLEDEVSKHRTKLDNEYTSKLKTELAQQQTLLAQQNTLRKSKYLEDVRAYEKAEKEKTRIFKEQDKQRIRGNNSSRSENNSSRSGNNSSVSSRSGSSTGLLRNVGRSLTAYSVGNMSTTSTSSSNSTYNFNVQGLSVEQVLSYAKQKNRLRG